MKWEERRRRDEKWRKLKQTKKKTNKKDTKVLTVEGFTVWGSVKEIPLKFKKWLFFY